MRKNIVMKISFVYAQVANNTIRIDLSNGADSSLEIMVDGIVFPQLKTPDAASLDVCKGDEALVRLARKSLCNLLNTRWGKCQPTWGRQVTISTRCGKLTGSTSSCNAFRIDDNGDILIEGFRLEEYEGAFNAIGQGTGWSLAGWTNADAKGDWEVREVESTYGTFSSLSEYALAREAKCVNAS